MGDLGVTKAVSDAVKYRAVVLAACSLCSPRAAASSCSSNSFIYFTQSGPAYTMEADRNTWAVASSGEPGIWLVLVIANSLRGETCTVAALQEHLFGLERLAHLLHGRFQASLQVRCY